ncbi:hypothetical protein SDJN03_01114, partial [Cucurbita argyrosperma subsp. sororia]
MAPNKVLVAALFLIAVVASSHLRCVRLIPLTSAYAARQLPLRSMASLCHCRRKAAVLWFAVLTLSVFAISSLCFLPLVLTLQMPWLCLVNVVYRSHRSVIFRPCLVYAVIFEVACLLRRWVVLV